MRRRLARVVALLSMACALGLVVAGYVHEKSMLRDAPRAPSEVNRFVLNMHGTQVYVTKPNYIFANLWMPMAALLGIGGGVVFSRSGKG